MMRIAFAVLTLALLAGVVVGREKPTQQVLETQPQEADFDVSRLERRQPEAPSGDPFASRAFGAAAFEQAAVEPLAAAPARPAAPALPFRYMGKVVEDGKTEILLLRGDEHFAVAAGQKIDGEYRLDQVTASALTITYLPLKTKQTLELTP